ncbi:hemagglutinin repeat-containing protein [Bordetella sp. LUAb4]|uniref:hemagglutinin repeat-containing protein n=1 Tax=Bordetella sp. LUAb4 TaxID=2843195 RepID=UPI001E36B812|nr:hemagglutinin repeat-containing protein [Bordetella sp. LUAb4]
MTNAYSAVARNPASAGGVSFNVDVGVSNSRQRQESSASAVSSSTVQAGRDVNLKASGEDSRIVVEGSQLTAARNAVLQTDGDLVLTAAATTQQTNSKQSSSSASVGVGFAIGGTQNGFTINLAASTARGNAEGNSVTWTPSTVQAGGVAVMEPGGDTQVLGSQALASQIIANVGGDLTVESLQDTAVWIPGR